MNHIFEATWAARYLIGFVVLFFVAVCVVVAVSETTPTDWFDEEEE